MNILLTGGSGYIGSHVAVVLIKNGHDVVLYDNLANSDSSIVQRIDVLSPRPCKFVHGDVLDTYKLEKCLQDYRIDAVIHLAGYKSVSESVDDPLLYYNNNVSGTISLLKAMASACIKKIVFSSSATVYGNPEYLPLDEGHPTFALNPYGRSKLHSEEILKDVAESDSGWCVVSLRYFNPVGSHETGLLGERPRGRPNNLVPYITEVATRKAAFLRIFGDDYATSDGTGVRDYIHVLDLADGHASALNFLEANKGWHAINLGTGQAYSVFEVVKCFEKASGRTIPFKVESRRQGDVAASYADADKARKLLNWSAKRTLDDMCRSAWLSQQVSHESGS